ncbi:hypothetical protein TcCL_NonESM09959 [Trypanosoma cruzi]|nr:hypothetical protein TcCL_NonESM09959 [Trypanosoma cruzi]
MQPLTIVLVRRRQRQVEETADRDKQLPHCYRRGSEAESLSGLSPNPRAPPPLHPPLEGPRRPAQHQRYQSSWGQWFWQRHRPCRWRPHLLPVLPQQTSHHRRPHRRCTEDRSPSKPPAAHPRCRWARAPRCLSEHLGLTQVDILRCGVPRPGSMLSATGTDARGKACSVDAGETVLLHSLSPRRPTEPLQEGYRWWRISCTPPRGHGK